MRHFGREAARRGKSGKQVSTSSIMEEDMKTRRIAVVILLALVLAALLPLSASADKVWDLLYIYGQVRVGNEGLSAGIEGATLELYRNGQLIATKTTKGGNADFGFGVSPMPASYKVVLALPAGSGLTPREIKLAGQAVFSVDPAKFGFRWSDPTVHEAQVGPIVFWCDGTIDLPTDQPAPAVYIFGRVEDVDWDDPLTPTTEHLVKGIEGAQVQLTRFGKVAAQNDVWTKFTGKRGYYGFGVSGQDNNYELKVLSVPAPWVLANITPAKYSFVLPAASPAVGPFIFQHP